MCGKFVLTVRKRTIYIIIQVKNKSDVRAAQTDENNYQNGTIPVCECVEEEL